MRAETDRAKLEALMTALGRAVHGPGRIYLAGGATAVWYGWRQTTVDVDIKPDPEPPGLFEATREGHSPLCPPNPCGRRGRRPSQSTIREGHGPPCPPILADGEDAVPPMPLTKHRTPLCVLCVSVVKPKTRVRPPNPCGRRGRRPSQWHEAGGAQSPAPVFLNPGRGTVLCARQILADGGDAVPPNPPSGRGTVLRARQFLRTAGTPSLPCLWRDTAPLSVSSVSLW
jgi:hypothetical protein